ncbi:unnamed protein product [Adineta ricciae]|uniref:Uncharacterized protein n=1 Tax=Adineta ricciae TaxID=249248 RepID=A0A815C3J7_ADIRI|nr:unnamed protein product [Adineta ricciae]CAF1634392.1 unnamed protein product [Adineta ricciae]
MSTVQYQNQHGDQRQHIGTPDIGEMEKRFNDAKTYILSTQNKKGVNLYNHLVKCVSRLLTEQPRDSAIIFEDVSKSVRSEDETHVEDQPPADSEQILNEEQKPLFEKGENTDDLDEDALQSPLPHILEQAYYFEQAGIGLGRDETYQIWLALKQLVDKSQFEKLRFWGKILGTEKNYYVAEVEQNADEEVEEEEENEENNENDEKDADEDEEGEGEEDPLPKSAYKSPPTVPKEERGTGVNKYTYYVCNRPGAPWVRLPTVTPAQISLARQIKVFFTGDLTREIKSFPVYPGTEKHYLRAQIARISATTQVSPNGRFKFSEEEEEEEEGGRQNYEDNEDFTGAPLSELIDEELNGWVHHVLHILPQGRTKWWNPKEDAEEEEQEEENEEEDGKAEDRIQPEQGPPLLTPIGADAEIHHTKAWTAKISSNLIPQYACAFVRSNLWPGAYAFARGTIWENIYIGYGHKYSTSDYRPELPPIPASEYNDGPEITEADDPTAEDEEKARLAAEKPEEEEEGEEEVENEDEED